MGERAKRAEAAKPKKKKAAPKKADK